MSTDPDIPAMPNNVTRWKQLVQSRGLRGKSIHDNSFDDSASEMSMDQYLLLQALWTWKPFEQLVLDHWTRDKHRTTAHDHLKPDMQSHVPASPWAAYLHSIEHNLDRRTTNMTPLAEFSIVRQLQIPLSKTIKVPLDSIGDPDGFGGQGAGTFIQSNASYVPLDVGAEPSTPTPVPAKGDDGVDSDMELDSQPLSDVSSSPLSDVPRHVASPTQPMTQMDASTILAVRDEEIVNISLIVFLQALTVHCKSVSGEWVPHRRPFIMKTQQNAKIYEARVDGYLESNQGEIRAIIEVKPYIRYGKAERRIKIQESAEMAAWIFEDAPEDFEGRQQRLLVCQDRQEVYLTIASYDEDYVKYLRGQKDPGGSFLEMTDHGPFDMFNWKHVRLLGELLLGFSIQECPAAR